MLKYQDATVDQMLSEYLLWLTQSSAMTSFTFNFMKRLLLFPRASSETHFEVFKAFLEKADDPSEKKSEMISILQLRLEKGQKLAEKHLDLQTKFELLKERLDNHDELDLMVSFLKNDVLKFAESENGVTQNNYGYVQLFFE